MLPMIKLFLSYAIDDPSQMSHVFAGVPRLLIAVFKSG